MPRKKGVLLKKQASQKRLIATRLIQISLLVDDYVYQQKPMSVKSADTYIKEISGYKERCYQDVRSLQVIEKLTRCLKGIIHEQQELTGECYEEIFPPSQQTSEATMLSHVYSTVDEDLTQCSEIDEMDMDAQEDGNNYNYPQINDSRNDIDKEIDHSNVGGTNMVIGMDKTKRITELNHNITQTEQNQQNADLEAINLCEQSHPNVIGTNTFAIDMTKSVTENLNDVTHTEKKPQHLEVINLCEQSQTNVVGTNTFGIDMTKSVKENLNDVTHTEKNPQHLEVINLCDNEIELINQSNINLEPYFYIQNAISHLSIKGVKETYTSLSQNCSQSILESFCPTELVKDKADPLTLGYVDVTTPKEQPKPATEITTNKITKISLPSIIHTNEQKINLHKELPIQHVNGKVPEIINSAKVTKPAVKKRKPNKNTKGITEQNKPQSVKRQAKTQKEKCVMKSQTAIQCLCSGQSDLPVQYKPLTYSKKLLTNPVTKTQKKSKDLPIYKRTILNDLSWIENIRFVREIPSEEYTFCAEDHTFWENYTLPNQWSETDFNY